MLTDNYIRGVAYALGKIAALRKVAGGPGSGVSGNNTKPIGLPHSEHVSVGTRKGILENMHYRLREIPLGEITHVGQSKFVPAKLKKMVKMPEIVKTKPIDVLQVGEHSYHVIDGHHRYLAAKELGFETIKAKVRKKARVTMKGRSTLLRSKLREG